MSTYGSEMETSVCPPVARPRKEGGFLSFCCQGPCRAADKSQVQKWDDRGVGLAAPAWGLSSGECVSDDLGSSPGLSCSQPFIVQ